MGGTNILLRECAPPTSPHADAIVGNHERPTDILLYIDDTSHYCGGI